MKSVFVRSILLGCAAFLLAGCGGADRRHDAILKINSLLSKGKTVEARSAVGKYLKDSEGDLEAYATASALYSKYALKADAAKIGREALDGALDGRIGRGLHPRVKSMYLRELGFHIWNVNDRALATEIFTEAIALTPDDAVALNDFGYLCADAGIRLDESERMLEKAHNLAPNDPNIIDSLGWVLFKKGDYNKSLTYLKQAVQKLPGNAEVRYHLGAVYDKLKRNDEAEIELNKTLILDFGMTEAKNILKMKGGTR